MLLFETPNRTRVRVISKRIYWAEGGSEKTVAMNHSWVGTVTDSYYTYKGVRRRLVVNHSISFWKAYGVWQRDIEVEVINEG